MCFLRFFRSRCLLDRLEKQSSNTLACTFNLHVLTMLQDQVNVFIHHKIFLPTISNPTSSPRAPSQYSSLSASKMYATYSLGTLSSSQDLLCRFDLPSCAPFCMGSLVVGSLQPLGCDDRTDGVHYIDVRDRPSLLQQEWSVFLEQELDFAPSPVHWEATSFRCSVDGPQQPGYEASLHISASMPCCPGALQKATLGVIAFTSSSTICSLEVRIVLGGVYFWAKRRFSGLSLLVDIRSTRSVFVASLVHCSQTLQYVYRLLSLTAEPAHYSDARGSTSLCPRSEHTWFVLLIPASPKPVVLCSSWGIGLI